MFKMSLPNRALLLAGVIALTQVGIRTFDSYLSPMRPLPAEQDLASLPLVFDEWRGSDIPLDDAVLENLGAAATVNRYYRNPLGEGIGVNVAVFTDYGTGVPHAPLDCYPR